MSDLETIRSKFEALRPMMDERMRRLWAGCEARSIGRGGVAVVAAATGLDRNTVRAGVEELERLAEESLHARWPVFVNQYRVRRPGAGAKPVEVKDPGILPALKQLIDNDEAGDPMSEAKWVRTSLRHLSNGLKEMGHPASTGTVRRLLKQMGYSMKANKRRQVHSKDPERDQQFRYIASQKEKFKAAALPIISVDTKKKELIGNFKNDGKAWCKEAEEVDEHDFPSGAECNAVPFGVYDVARNTGHVVVGVSNNTPEFAATAIAGWWRGAGGQGRLSGGEGTPDPGRRRGRQRQPGKGVEAESAGAGVRRLRAGGDGLPLSARLLEVEPGRTPPVQPDQPQLGRQAPAVAHHHARLHPRDHDDDRTEGHRPPGQERLPQGAQGLQANHATR